MTIAPESNDSIGIYSLILQATYTADCDRKKFLFPIQVAIAPKITAYYEIAKTHEFASWSASLPDGLLDVTSALLVEVDRAPFVNFYRDTLSLSIWDLSDIGIAIGEYFVQVTVTFANGE